MSISKFDNFGRELSIVPPLLPKQPNKANKLSLLDDSNYARVQLRIYGPPAPLDGITAELTLEKVKTGHTWLPANALMAKGEENQNWVSRGWQSFQSLLTPEVRTEVGSKPPRIFASIRIDPRSPKWELLPLRLGKDAGKKKYRPDIVSLGKDFRSFQFQFSCHE